MTLLQIEQEENWLSFWKVMVSGFSILFLECRLTEKRFQKMYQDVFEITENEQDGSVRIYMLCKNCESKTVTIGETMGQLEILQSDVIVV